MREPARFAGPQKGVRGLALRVLAGHLAGRGSPPSVDLHIPFDIVIRIDNSPSDSMVQYGGHTSKAMGVP
jgi:hypothetical protein